MAADGLTEAEVARGKGMSKGSFVLGLEDTGSRMSRLAKGELLYGDLMPVDELLARVDAVTVADVNTLAAELLSRPMSLAVVGPFGRARLRRLSPPPPGGPYPAARCRRGVGPSGRRRVGVGSRSGPESVPGPAGGTVLVRRGRASRLG